MLELIDDLRHEEHLTVITSLHDLGVAGQFADRVAVLASGRLVASGRPAEVLTSELIGRHWGVDAEVIVDDRGVSVTVQRRRGHRSAQELQS